MENRYSLPKGPWTRNLDLFHKTFCEDHILLYKNAETGNVKHRMGYRMFKAGKVSNIFLHYNKDGRKIIIKGKIKAAMKNKSYAAHVCINSDGTVDKGLCQCISGLSGRCKHTFAILWLLLDFVREEKSFVPEDIACTSKTRAWGTGSNVSLSIPLEKMNFIKPDPSKKDKATEKNINKRRDLLKHCKKVNVLTEDMLKNHHSRFKENGLFFLADVIESNQFRPEKIYIENESNDDSRDSIDIPQISKWENKFHDIAETYNIPNTDKLLAHCQISINEAVKLEKLTKNQNSSPLWYHERGIRLTSSKFGEVKRKKPVNEQMINRIWPKNSFKTAAMKLGIENERKAAEKYILKHPHYQLSTCGLCVNPGVPFLATSPDRIVFNSCSQKCHLLEIKTLVKGGLLLNLKVADCVRNGLAPYLEIDQEGNINLKKTHSYYAQIQGQMALTGFNKCHFMADSGCDMFIEEIDFDEHLWVTLYLPILTSFYFNHFEKSLQK